MEERPYQQCSLSVMDTIADPNITFDEKGICNYYYQYLEDEKKVFNGEVGAKKLEEIVAKIKEKGKIKSYDCLIGVSGGVDSTFLAMKVKELGLRPLAIHLDNGWNSELAVKNIENIMNKLNIDLYTYVLDWEEFRDLQLSFFKADVIDIEALTDHAILAILYQQAMKHKIKYIISGNNVVTEAVLPSAWVFKDPINIKDIHRKFGKVKLKTFPFLNYYRRFIIEKFLSLEYVQMLNLIDYDKKDAKKQITEKLEWRDYGGKHYESIFTRFYQGYILPEKFKVDKRKAHLSNLIFSGQMTKEEALEELKKPIYAKEQYRTDKEFALKKLGFSESEFENYINRPAVCHKKYAHQKSIFQKIPILNVLKPLLKKIFKP